jgi:hypothetical protein
MLFFVRSRQEEIPAEFSAPPAEEVLERGIQVGTRAWEKTMEIGGKNVVVRAYKNYAGKLVSVFIRK